MNFIFIFYFYFLFLFLDLFLFFGIDSHGVAEQLGLGGGIPSRNFEFRGPRRSPARDGASEQLE